MSSRRNKLRLLRKPPFTLVIYLLFRGLIMFIRMVPHPAPRPVVKTLSFLWRTLDRRHRGIAANNLKAAGYSDEIPELIVGIYDHFTRTLFETLNIARLIRARGIDPFVRVDNWENVTGLKGGAILVIGHMGNWELAGLAAGPGGLSLSTLARPIDNPRLDRWLTLYRTSTGMEIIPKSQAARKLTKLLRNGGKLIVQADQVPHPRSNGIVVPFFGQPALTVRSPAILALKYDCPIVPTNIWRDPDGFLHLDFTSPLVPEIFRKEEDPVRSMTAAFTSRLETFIRSHPEQWNWLHRRWKKAKDPARKVKPDTIPAGKDPAAAL